MKVANILLNGVRYESDLSENAETGESQMSMKLLCIAIYRMPPSLRSLCTNHFLGEDNHFLKFHFTSFSFHYKRVFIGLVKDYRIYEKSLLYLF